MLWSSNRIKPSLFSHPPETAYLWGLYQSDASTAPRLVMTTNSFLVNNLDPSEMQGGASCTSDRFTSKRDGCDAFNHIISSSTTNALGIEEYRQLLDRYAEPSQHMTINLRLGAGLPPWTCWSMNAWTTIIHVLHPLQASPFGYSKAQLIS